MASKAIIAALAMPGQLGALGLTAKIFLEEFASVMMHPAVAIRNGPNLQWSFTCHAPTGRSSLP